MFLIRSTIFRGGGDQGQEGGPLDTLAVAVGVHGQSVKIPGALGVPEKEVPKIYIMVAALVVSERASEQWSRAMLLWWAAIASNATTAVVGQR